MHVDDILTYLNLLCLDMGAAVQLMGIIRTLLDPENMLASVNKSEKTDFLNHFYKHCMHGKINERKQYVRDMRK